MMHSQQHIILCMSLPSNGDGRNCFCQWWNVSISVWSRFQHVNSLFLTHYCTKPVPVISRQCYVILHCYTMLCNIALLHYIVLIDNIVMFTHRFLLTGVVDSTLDLVACHMPQFWPITFTCFSVQWYATVVLIWTVILLVMIRAVPILFLESSNSSTITLHSPNGGLLYECLYIVCGVLNLCVLSNISVNLLFSVVVIFV